LVLALLTYGNPGIDIVVRSKVSGLGINLEEKEEKKKRRNK